MIHYHGTPITPRARLLELAGRSFCVSYADPRDVAVCHEMGQSVMLDNGAFSFWRDKMEGRPLSKKATAAANGDWSGFYEWCRPWLDYQTTWAIIPDVIDGDEEANDALIDEWPYGHRGAPVWHLHESLGRLDSLCAWPRICFGSSGDFAQVADARWHRRMAEAMEVVCDDDGCPRTWIHMLRGLALAGSRYPFASADSTNIARNHNGNNTRNTPRKDVNGMADRLDARQCPALWVPEPQLALRVA